MDGAPAVPASPTSPPTMVLHCLASNVLFPFGSEGDAVHLIRRVLLFVSFAFSSHGSLSETFDDISKDL